MEDASRRALPLAEARSEGPGKSRRRPEGTERLASLDAEALVRRLESAGVRPGAARAAAGKALRHAFASAAPGPWDDATLSALGLGATTRRALLSLDPEPSLELAERAPSGDGTLRLLFRAPDGAYLESVLIPGPARTTLCISSQVGCARACAFCETGRLGLERQLSAGEIVDQVRLARLEWSRSGGRPPLQNLVYMGMGEPFDNLEEVLRSIRLLTDPRAFGLSPSRVTVSTVGVVDKLPAFFAGARAELAVSLNAPDDARRGRIMPVNRRWDLGALREGLARTLPPGRRVLFEYVLFDGWNDADADADALADYVRPLPCRVNVIPCNPGPDPDLRPPSPERLDAFVARLSALGVTTLVRRPRGRDVGGACGQLAGQARRASP